MIMRQRFRFLRNYHKYSYNSVFLPIQITKMQNGASCTDTIPKPAETIYNNYKGKRVTLNTWVNTRPRKTMARLHCSNIAQKAEKCKTTKNEPSFDCVHQIREILFTVNSITVRKVTGKYYTFYPIYLRYIQDCFSR